MFNLRKQHQNNKQTNKQLSIPPTMEENAMVSRPGDLEMGEIEIVQENHADMDTFKAGPLFGGEAAGILKLKENAEIGPAAEPMDPSEAEPSRSEPRSRSKLKEPEEIGSTSGGFNEPVSSDTNNFSEEFQPETWKIELYRLVASGKTESFNRLYKNKPITIPQLTPQGNSALHVAAQYKKADMAAAIIQHKRELVNFPNMNGDLPLHIAARVGCLRTSSVLIQQKELNMDIKNKQGDTALHDAVRGAHLDVVILLVGEYPSWTRTVNNFGESPLFLAVDKWHLDIATILRESDGFIKGRDSMNVLHAAIIRLGQGKLPNILTILL